MYEGVKSEVINIIRFDENLDLSMTYLARTDMTRASKSEAEEKFPISEQEYMIGKLLDGTLCQILLDIGGSKSFMSKLHYLRCKPLHSSPKFASKTQRIQVRNGQYLKFVTYYTSSDRYTGGSHLSHTVVKLDSHLAWNFCLIFFPFPCII